MEPLVIKPPLLKRGLLKKNVFKRYCREGGGIFSLFIHKNSQITVTSQKKQFQTIGFCEVMIFYEQTQRSHFCVVSDISYTFLYRN